MKPWEVYPDLCRTVRATHVSAGMESGDHSFDHALRVAHMAARLLDSPRGQQLVIAAGLCHNADRIVQKMGVGRSAATNEAVRVLVEEWLTSTTINNADRPLIVNAVLGHCGANCSTDHDVLRALRDGDRIVNIQPDVVMRAAKQDVPPVDVVNLLGDPNASYFRPGSVLWDLWYMATKWDPGHPDHDPKYMLTMPKAVEIGQPYFLQLRAYVQSVLDDRQSCGLVPYPNMG